MNIIQSPDMPLSNGHYSMCIEHNGTLYTAGQLPIDPVSKLIPETIEEQTQLVLAKIETIVKAGGSSKENIIQMRLYISDISLWSRVNEVYAGFFGKHKPVRAVIPTRDLHYGCLIEVEAVAAIENNIHDV